MNLFVNQDILLYDKLGKKFVIFNYNKSLDDGNVLALIFPFNLGIEPFIDEKNRSLETAASIDVQEMMLSPISQIDFGKTNSALMM